MSGEIRTPNTVRKYLRKIADNYAGTVVPVGIRGLVIGKLNSICGNGQMRRYFLSWVFGDGGCQQVSSRDLSDAHIKALFEWMGTYQEDGVWQHAITFEYELKQMMIEVRHHFSVKEVEHGKF